MRIFTVYFCIVVISALCAHGVYGQTRKENIKTRKLQAYVCTEEGEAISGIVLCRKGQIIPYDATDGTGMTFIDLASYESPGDTIDLALVQGVPANRDWEIPPGSRVLIHKDKPNAFSTVMLRSRTFRRESEKIALQPRGDAPDPRNKQTSFIDGYIRLGNYHYSNGRFQDALDEYNKVLKDSLDSDVFLFSFSLTLAQLNRIGEALSYMEKCLNLRKAKGISLELAIAHENHALLLIRGNQQEKAEEQLTAAQAVREELKKRSSNQ